jgi:hypothetical protein
VVDEPGLDPFAEALVVVPALGVAFPDVEVCPGWLAALDEPELEPLGGVLVVAPAFALASPAVEPCGGWAATVCDT